MKRATPGRGYDLRQTVWRAGSSAGRLREVIDWVCAVGYVPFVFDEPLDARPFPRVRCSIRHSLRVRDIQHPEFGRRHEHLRSRAG